MRFISAIVALACLVATAAPANALRRQARDDVFFRKTAITGFAGVALPLGNFASSRDGDGNHRSWPFDWAAEIEHFVDPYVSLGFSVGGGTFEDKDMASLETRVTNYAGFFRYMIETRSQLHPYLRFGMGGESVQFQDANSRFSANSAFYLQVGGGSTVLASPSFGLTGQILYHHGFIENQFVSGYDEPVIVGFDSSYFTFSAGVSVFFR